MELGNLTFLQKATSLSYQRAFFFSFLFVIRKDKDTNVACAAVHLCFLFIWENNCASVLVNGDLARGGR